VACGGGSRLCYGDDVPAYRDRRGSMGVQEFLRGIVVLLGRSQEVGAAGCRGFMGEVDRAGFGSLCQLLREP
jgi:hypothetical protein